MNVSAVTRLEGDTMPHSPRLRCQSAVSCSECSPQGDHRGPAAAAGPNPAAAPWPVARVDWSLVRCGPGDTRWRTGLLHSRQCTRRNQRATGRAGGTGRRLPGNPGGGQRRSLYRRPQHLQPVHLHGHPHGCRHLAAGEAVLHPLLHTLAQCHAGPAFGHAQRLQRARQLSAGSRGIGQAPGYDLPAQHRRGPPEQGLRQRGV